MFGVTCGGRRPGIPVCRRLAFRRRAITNADAVRAYIQATAAKSDLARQRKKEDGRRPEGVAAVNPARMGDGPVWNGTTFCPVTVPAP